MFTRKDSTTETGSRGRRFTDDAGELDTVVGADARIKGEIEGRTNVELRGSLAGACKVEGLVWQRPEGRFRGELRATMVVLEGKVEGTVIAEDKIELRSTCRVEGDIQARSVAIGEGSFFEGQIKMTGDGAAGPLSFKEERGKTQGAETAAAPEPRRKPAPSRKKVEPRSTRVPKKPRGSD